MAKHPQESCAQAAARIVCQPCVNNPSQLWHPAPPCIRISLRKIANLKCLYLTNSNWARSSPFMTYCKWGSVLSPCEFVMCDSVSAHACLNINQDSKRLWILFDLQKIKRYWKSTEINSWKNYMNLSCAWNFKNWKHKAKCSSYF